MKHDYTICSKWRALMSNKGHAVENMSW